MAVTLLNTKLYMPPTRRELVSRPRLVERLQAGLDRRLTLVSAPAGFGKTTLLSECAARCNPAVCWLSLDERDNNPVRFWTYFVAALQTLGEGLGTDVLEALQAPRAQPSEALIGQLANEISELPGPHALILDDAHLITNPQIHEQLVFLVEHLPAQMHLVVSSRADPPWPLARWRARDQVIEVRTDDLRFTPAEAATFLNEAMGLDLTAEEVAALGTRTEGWIAGLQLAAVALQGTPSPHGREAASFVRAFSGSHRFILDYLVEEVLDRQPAHIQQFLIETSILERLTASLCAAVRFGPAGSPSSSGGTAAVRFGPAESPSSSGGTGAPGKADSQAILEYLERANLFLVPLDGERRWYRYHRLFADLLRSRLEQEPHERLATLHRRASAWYEGQGLISEAVGHALAVGEVEQVARMAKRNVLAMMDHGELTTMAGWLDALPEETVRSQPWLCVAQAWPLAYAGQGDAVEPLLRDAERAQADVAEGDEAERRRLAGHLAAIRAYVLGGRGDLSGAADLARQALTCLPVEDTMPRGWAAYQLGFMLRMGGYLQAAAQALEQAAMDSQAVGDSHVAVLALGELGVVRLQQGLLHEAADTYGDALALADDHARRSGRRLPAAGYVLARLSGVLREWNALDAAIEHARDGLALCQQWQQADALLEAYLHLARALHAAGHVESARQALQGATQVARATSPWFVTYTQAQAMRMRLAEQPAGAGDAARFGQWAEQGMPGAGDQPSFQYELMYRLLARSLIEQGDWDRGLGLLARLLSLVERAGAQGHAIEIMVLQAVALEIQGKGAQALTALKRALTLAEPEGYIRTFLDEGPVMGTLLRRAVLQGIAVGYASKLLAALEEGTTAPASSPDAVPTLAEPLSPRETEVLRLLTTHLSHAELADELVVSVNTVRSHVKSIYSKLDVHSRLEAVARARELGLLD